MPTAVPNPQTPTSSSGKALASLIFGILAILCVPLNFLPALVGLLLGILGVRDVNRSAGQITGKGLAIAGIVTSCVGFLCGCISIGSGVPLYFAGLESRDKVRSTNNLKVIGLATHNYYSTYDRLPSAIANEQQKPILSIRVQLLPYLEYDSLYRQMDLKQPWDSSRNAAFLSPCPKWLQDPQNPKAPAEASPYRFFVGPNTLFSEPGQKSKYSMGNIPDGTSNTILCVGATDGVPWSKPEELTYVPGQTLSQLGPKGRDYFIVLLADGSVHYVKKTISETTLKNAINPADGNGLGPDW